MENAKVIIARQKDMWRQANVKLLPSLALLIAGLIFATNNHGIHGGDFGHKLLAIAGIVIFVISAFTFLHILTDTLAKLLILRRMRKGRAASLRFVLRLLGYAIILLKTLDLVGIPVGKLVLGGAAIGIILGVAAQQSLANFFASIVLILAHPFAVGDEIEFSSGALGGQFTGTIKDIGLVHTKIKDADGKITLLPNSMVLSGAAIIKH